MISSDVDNAVLSACSASFTPSRRARCERTPASTPTSDLPGRQLLAADGMITQSWKERTHGRSCRLQRQPLCILDDSRRPSPTTSDDVWNLAHSTSSQNVHPWQLSATSSPYFGAAHAVASETSLAKNTPEYLEAASTQAGHGTRSLASRQRSRKASRPSYPPSNYDELEL